MRAYRNIKFTEGPDIADVKSEGRRTRVGRIPRGETFTKYVDGIVAYADGTPGRTVTKVVRNDRGYCKPASKAAVRRQLKRADRKLTARFEAQAEGLDLKQVRLADLEAEAAREAEIEEASMSYYAYDVEDFVDDYEYADDEVEMADGIREEYEAFLDTLDLDYLAEEYFRDYDYD